MADTNQKNNVVKMRGMTYSKEVSEEQERLFRVVRNCGRSSGATQGQTILSGMVTRLY